MGLPGGAATDGTGWTTTRRTSSDEMARRSSFATEAGMWSDLVHVDRMVSFTRLTIGLGASRMCRSSRQTSSLTMAVADREPPQTPERRSCSPHALQPVSATTCCLGRFDHGGMFFVTSNGLFHMTNGKPKPYLLRNAALGKPVAVYRDPQHQLWVGTMNAVVRLVPRKDGLAYDEVVAAQIASPVTVLLGDKQGSLWIGTRHAGIWRISGWGSSLTRTM